MRLPLLKEEEEEAEQDKREKTKGTQLVSKESQTPSRQQQRSN
jgi:hypothetical protein